MRAVAADLSAVSVHAQIGWRRVLPFLAVLLLGAPAASGAGSDFAAIDFVAAAPFTYDRTTGGGAYNDGTTGNYDDLVNELEGGEIRCGQIVTYLVKVDMRSTTGEPVQAARLEFRFLANTTGQPGVAHSRIAGVSINYGSVENGDDGTGVNPGLGSYGLDSAIHDDGGSSATLVSQTLTGPLFTAGSELVAVIDVSDLEAAESVVLRINVQLECQPGSHPTGNLQADLVSATALPSNTTISTGAQTIPFNNVQDVEGADEPLLEIVKNVTTEDGSCSSAADELDITAGEVVKYCYTISNSGTATLYNVVLSDDGGTSGNTSDDFTVTLTGLADLDGDGQIDDLTFGGAATGTATMAIRTVGTVVNTATAAGDNGLTGSHREQLVASDTATVRAAARPNVPPVANDDSASTLEDTPVTIDVLANDTDGDADTLTVASVTQGANGTVVNNGSDVTYTPNANFYGSDSFAYTADDGYGGTDTATVSVTVIPVNDPPVAVDDTASTNEDTPVVGDVLANDTDIEGDTLTVASVTQGTRGTVVNNGSNVSYTPNLNFYGTDSFTYTVSDGHGGTDTAIVTVTVSPINDPPVALDDTTSTNEDTPVVVDVLANDTDIEGDTLTVASVTQGTHGTVVNNGSNVSYAPSTNFHGSDNFTYTVSDGHGGTDTATVTVTVISVNDPPVAVDDTASTNEDTPVTVNVLANDSDVDGDPLGVASVTQGTNGTVINNGSNVSYTPNANFHGWDSFTYTISDGHGGTDTATVTVTVSAVNDPPVANNDSATTPEDTPVTIDVLANDTDVDGDTLTVTSVTQGSSGTVVNNGSNVSYTPNANFHGSDGFTYTISDGNGGTSTAAVTVTVSSVNDPPVAVNDAASTNEDTPVTVDVLANDSDVDGDPLAVTGASAAAHGTVVVNPDGTITYTPAANSYGSDSFTYSISDGNGGTGTATVSVTVNAVNDPPVAVDDVASTNEDTAVTVNVLANDSDVDGDSLTIVSVTPGTSGAVTNNGSNVSYTPHANFYGSDSFTYTISDGQGGTDTATVTVTVNAVNDPPEAADDAASTSEDTAVTVSVLANDTDIDGDTLTVASVTQGANGTVVNNGSNVTYTPNLNFNGSDSFTYTVSDSHGGTDIATVTVTVNAVNDPPMAVDDTSSTNEDVSVTVNVLANDIEVDGDALIVAGASGATNGTEVVNPDGTITYTPAPNFNGSDSFTYTISDGHGGTGTATVTVIVVPVVDWINVVTLPVEKITPHSALLNGLLVDEGEEACEVHFQYGLVTSMDTLPTTPLSDIRTGNPFETPVTGLTPGTTYHYWATAKNSAGFALGEPVEFTTPVRLTISSTRGGTVVEPGIGEFLYPEPNDVNVTAIATDTDYYFWCWQGTAAAKVQDIDRPNTTVVVDNDDTLRAAFLKNTPVLPDDLGPLTCRGAEFSTSQYWVFGDPAEEPGTAMERVYDIAGVPPGGQPPLPGTSLTENTPPVAGERWWSTDVLWGSGRSGLLVPDGLCPSIHVWVSGFFRTMVSVQVTWHPAEGIDNELFPEGMPYEPVLENVEPVPLAPAVLVNELALDNGWRHSTYEWELSPGVEIVSFTIRGRIAVDTLIVDTCTVTPVWANVVHVDGHAPSDPGPNDASVSDPLEDGTLQHPFDSIQEAIDLAADEALVLVHEGRYRETIDLSGKAITVAAEWLVDSNVLAPSIIDSAGAGPVVRMTGGEGDNSLLSGLTITGNREPNVPAVVCDGSRGLISHCVVCGNMSLSNAGATVACVASETKFINCTLTGNRTGPSGAVLRFVDSPKARVLNTIVWGNDGPAMTTTSGSGPRVDYSDIQGGYPGHSILDLLPHFGDPGYWDDRGTVEDLTDDLWVLGDYHLRSSQGRLNIETEIWLLDDLDSPGIDSGNPESVWLRESQPDGSRINMGLYGGTEQASKSPVQ